jgi:hypothetical protein
MELIPEAAFAMFSGVAEPAPKWRSKAFPARWLERGKVPVKNSNLLS